MGCFSWMFADTNNRKPLNIGEEGYLMAPDGKVYHEKCYDGYGVFDGHDVYELVVDWNLEYLRPELPLPKRRNDDKQVRFFEPWADAVIRLLKEGKEDEAQEYMNRIADNRIVPGYLRRDWKRHIGIEIACYDYQNRHLAFPIKISSTDTIPYDGLPASDADPDQGFGPDYFSCDDCEDDE